jgi:hypothetical protein
VFWILFENVMSLHRTKATIIGLFDIGNVNEWVVTEKLGNLRAWPRVSAKVLDEPVEWHYYSLVICSTNGFAKGLVRQGFA